MKMKILISLVACFIATGSFLGYNLTENTSRLDVSLADISVMAQADGESGDHVICYYESRVRVGHTYYDCGSCTKIYDEQGRGNYSKCWP